MKNNNNSLLGLLKLVAASENIFIGVPIIRSGRAVDDNAVKILNDFLNKKVIPFIKENDVEINLGPTGHVPVITKENINSLTVNHPDIHIDELSSTPGNELTEFSNSSELSINDEGQILPHVDLLNDELFIHYMTFRFTFYNDKHTKISSWNHRTRVGATEYVIKYNSDFYYISRIKESISKKQKEIEEKSKQIDNISSEIDTLKWIQSCMEGLKLEKERKESVRAHMLMDQIKKDASQEEMFTQITEIMAIKD